MREDNVTAQRASVLISAYAMQHRGAAHAASQAGIASQAGGALSGFGRRRGNRVTMRASRRPMCKTQGDGGGKPTRAWPFASTSFSGMLEANRRDGGD